ncbi:MAG: ABC transporter permease [Candidatus Bipolaricaulota bacterium]|nr:ABC transporter permease [Candidatus Bipolaricaulota bacterium]
MKGARLSGLRRFWDEYRQVKSGLIGIGLLVVFILIVLLEPVALPYREANQRWRDINYWQDSPRLALPVWVNWFTSKDYPRSTVISEPKREEVATGTLRVITMEVPYEFTSGHPPSDLYYKLYLTGRASIAFEFIRPDGEKVELRRSTAVDGAQILRLSAIETLQERAYAMGAKYEDPNVAKSRNPRMIDTMGVLFGQAAKGIFTKPAILDGTYRMKIQVALVNEQSQLNKAEFVVLGGVSGILGTDGSRRDLWCGFIGGTKWALLIGLLTSLISVVVGVVYGVAAGYFGGWIDALMNRIFEVVLSIPLLPILIVMSAVFNPSIWIIIAMMCVFFWVGPVKTVRSMALQIKEHSYIEAAKALGASHRRILFRHMVPQLIPYSFASMALAVPGAILFEASISLIGLGDPTIVSWGQVLRDAFSSGAVLQGIWWWIIPPGVAIALMGMTFAFIGFAMDTILNPKLKTR